MNATSAASVYEPTGTLRERMAREDAHRGRYSPTVIREHTLRRMSGWPASRAPLPSDPCRDPECATCHPATARLED